MSVAPPPPPHDLARTRHAAGLLVLDRLPYALIVVDEDLRPVIMNARARQAASGGGLVLDGDVRTAVSTATAATAAWLSAATALRIKVGAVAVPALILPAQVKADPMLMQRGLALIVFGEAEQTHHRELLRLMYRFTERECDLACALIAGGNLAEAARALGLSIATARTHLQRLLEKTGTKRQGELLHVLLGSSPE